MDSCLTAKEELLFFIKENCPSILGRLEREEIYLLFQRFEGYWFLIFETEKALEILMEKEKHQGLEVYVLTSRS